MTFLASKFFLVGSESRQALHKKCLILFGTLRDQILLQQLVWAEVSDGLGVDKSGLDISILYALLDVYFLDLVPTQMRRSGTRFELSGMPKICWASWGKNSYVTHSVIHLGPSSSIRAHTFAFIGRFFWGEMTCFVDISSSHLSPLICTEAPSPIRQYAPCLTTSLALRMLCQAYDPLDFTPLSRTEHVGKNLALKTL